MIQALYSIPLAFALLVGGAHGALADGGCFDPVMARGTSSSTKSHSTSTKAKTTKKSKTPKKATKKTTKSKKPAKPIQPTKKTTKKGSKATKKKVVHKPAAPAPNGNDNSQTPGR